MKCLCTIGVNLRKYEFKLQTIADIKRNSFVSFWLWFCAIINGLCVIGYFALLFSSKGLWTGTPESTWLRHM